MIFTWVNKIRHGKVFPTHVDCKMGSFLQLQQNKPNEQNKKKSKGVDVKPDRFQMECLMHNFLRLKTMTFRRCRIPIWSTLGRTLIYQMYADIIWIKYDLWWAWVLRVEKLYKVNKFWNCWKRRKCRKWIKYFRRAFWTNMDFVCNIPAISRKNPVSNTISRSSELLWKLDIFGFHATVQNFVPVLSDKEMVIKFPEKPLFLKTNMQKLKLNRKIVLYILLGEKLLCNSIYTIVYILYIYFCNSIYTIT